MEVEAKLTVKVIISIPVVVVEGGTRTTGELGMIDQDQDTYDGQKGGQSDNNYRPVLPLHLCRAFLPRPHHYQRKHRQGGGQRL